MLVWLYSWVPPRPKTTLISITITTRAVNSPRWGSNILNSSSQSSQIVSKTWPRNNLAPTRDLWSTLYQPSYPSTPANTLLYLVPTSTQPRRELVMGGGGARAKFSAFNRLEAIFFFKFKFFFSSPSSRRIFFLNFETERSQGNRVFFHSNWKPGAVCFHVSIFRV